MANQPTTPSNALTPPEQRYAKLSDESMSRVLAELKSLQDDPRTSWPKRDYLPPKG
jgi:hypothetical protein